MKKKLFMITLAVCLVVLSIASTSLAYFTDTDEKATVFTAGNVKIDLAFTDIRATKLYPGVTYSDNAVISNTGSEPAFIGAIIQIRGTSIANVVADNSGTTNGISNIPVAIEDLLVGLGADDWTVVRYTQAKDNNDAIIGWDVYAVKTYALPSNATSTVFTDIKIPAEWNNDQMAAMNGASLNIIAYATQTQGTGFNTAENALKTAFPEWAALDNTTNP